MMKLRIEVSEHCFRDGVKKSNIDNAKENINKKLMFLTHFEEKYIFLRLFNKTYFGAITLAALQRASC